jgi:hypothetical protein
MLVLGANQGQPVAGGHESQACNGHSSSTAPVFASEQFAVPLSDIIDLYGSKGWDIFYLNNGTTLIVNGIESAKPLNA